MWDETTRERGNKHGITLPHLSLLGLWDEASLVNGQNSKVVISPKLLLVSETARCSSDISHQCVSHIEISTEKLRGKDHFWKKVLRRRRASPLS